MPSQSFPGARAPRHPFRATVIAPPRVRLPSADDSDLKLFALSFTAFFICIYSFIF